jgi:hypothetical protein
MSQETAKSILVPAPTAWPFVAALGITLMFTGLVTHLMVSVVGLVILARASAGWWFDVLPGQKEDLVPVQPVAPVERSPLIVNRMAAGHRAQIPAEVHPYWTGIWGGAAGAVSMAAVAMLFGLISQGSIWYPINLLAAGVVSSLANAPVEELRHFSTVGLIAGSLIHVTISLFVGLLYAVTLPMFPRGATWRSGLVTPLLWSGLVASTLGFINPTLNARIDWTWFVASQLAFGVTAALVIARTGSIATMQGVPFMERAQVETQEKSDQ